MGRDGADVINELVWGGAVERGRHSPGSVPRSAQDCYTHHIVGATGPAPRARPGGCADFTGRPAQAWA